MDYKLLRRKDIVRFQDETGIQREVVVKDLLPNYAVVKENTEDGQTFRIGSGNEDRCSFIFEDFGLLRTGRFWKSFHSVEELKQELIRQGLPMHLAEFDTERLDVKNGYIKNSYQNWSAYAYPKRLWETRTTASKGKKKEETTDEKQTRSKDQQSVQKTDDEKSPAKKKRRAKKQRRSGTESGNAVHEKPERL